MRCSILVVVACLLAVVLGPGQWGFVRGVLTLGAVDSRQNTAYRTGRLNAAGRRALDLVAGSNDVSHLAPGVYFVCGQPAFGSGPSWPGAA